MTTDSKTREEKRMRFFDMQDHPQRYTDEEIAALLADEDIKTLAHDMAMAKRAMTARQTDEADVDEAWKAFAATNQLHLTTAQPRSHYRMKIAASIAGIALLSGIAFAAIHNEWLGSAEPTEIANNSDMTEVSDAHRTVSPTDSLTTQRDSTDLNPVVFEDAELGTILSQMATYYHMEVVYSRSARRDACQSKKATARHTRLYFHWDKRKTLQQNLDILNGFDRISVTIEGNVLRVE